MLSKVKLLSKLSLASYLRRVFQCRLLIWLFIRRDIRAQYAQTKLGVVWSFIQALTAIAIIHFFFGILYKININGNPFILFAFPGMAAWYYFAYIINNAGSSLIHSQHIIQKVHFPKLILPVYKTLTGLTELLIWNICYFFLLLFLRIPLNSNILFFPLVVVANMLAGFSIAIWIAALTVRFRDALHIIPFIAGFGIFATPVFFSEQMIPQKAMFFLYANPMAGVISLYRWCFLGYAINYNYLFGFVPFVIIAISGIYFFKSTEGKFADFI